MHNAGLLFYPNAMLGVDHDIIIFIRCMRIDADAKAKAGAGGREGADSRHGKTGRGGRQTHTVIVFCRLYTTDQTKKKKNYTNYFFSYDNFYVPNSCNFIYTLSVKTVNMAVNKYIIVQRLMTPIRLKYSSFCDIS